jgi:hypothetical protein
MFWTMAMVPRGVDPMHPHQALPGVVVRVKGSAWRSGCGGMRGVIEHIWGNPDHPALDVRFEDGRSELFWFHELETAQ